MKKSKKFLKVLSATAIAAIMATTMASTAAFAAVTTTDQYVKMPTNIEGEGTYAIYQVASAAVANGNNYYDYTVTSKSLSDTAGFETILKATNGNLYVSGSAGIEGISTDTLLTSSDNSTAQKVAAKLADSIKTGGTVNEDAMTSMTSLAAGATVALAPGYYLITYTGSVTAAPMLLAVTSAWNNTTTSPHVLTAKGSEIPLNKSITNITDGRAADNGSTGYGAVGSTVSYKLESKTPSYDTSVTAAKLNIPYAITDIPEDTLVITNNTITVKVGDATLVRGVDGNANKFYTDNTYVTEAATLSESTTATKKDSSDLSFGGGDNKGTGFTLTFDKAYTIAHQGENVEITFDAVLTNPTGATVDTGTNSNDNYAQVTYDNDYYANSTTPTTEEETVNVFSAEVDVTKTKEDRSALSGAGFTLYKKDGSDYSATGINPITGTADNVFNFVGLTAGTYKLVETTVPDGYKKAQDIEFKINEDGSVGTSFGGNFTYTNIDDTANANFTVISGKMSTDVINIAGQSLPGTGGVGTTMFTIGGIALVVVAGGMLTIYMKKRKTSEEE